MRIEPTCPRREGEDLALEMGDKSKAGFGQHFHLLPPEDPALPGHFPSGFWLYSGRVCGRVAVMARRLQLLEEWQVWCHLPEAGTGQSRILWLRGRRVGGVCSPWDLCVPSPCAHRGDSSVCSCWHGSPAPWIRTGTCTELQEMGQAICGKILGTACGLLGAPMVGLGDFSSLEVTVSDPCSEALQIQLLEAVTCSSEEKGGTEACPKACARGWVQLRCLPLSPPVSPGRPVSIPASCAKAG